MLWKPMWVCTLTSTNSRVEQNNDFTI